MDRIDITEQIDAAIQRTKQNAAPGQRGNLRPTVGDVLDRLAADPLMRDGIRLNAMTSETMLMDRPPWDIAGEIYPRSWRDSDDIELQVYFEGAGLTVRSTNMIRDAVLTHARRNSFHPVRDYLAGLVWDGEPRLERMLLDHFGVPINPYTQAVSAAFVISAVARIFEPGCKVDHMLVLEGRQGIGKSRALRVLSGGHIVEDLSDFHSKASVEALEGAWFVEVCELSGMSKSETEAVKSFLTRTYDKYRRPYARHAVTVARQCVFAGTTNETEYLRDRTGNRRFWPVRCEQINVERLAANRDQLFAEAVARYQEGEPWYLTDKSVCQQATEEQAARIEDHPWLAHIAETVANRDSISTRQILERLSVSSDRQAPHQAKVIAGLMRNLGWRDRIDKTGGSRERIWERK